MTIPWEKEEIPFLRHFGTRRGRYLANRLNLKGKNSEKLANCVSGYFWNLQAAITVHKVMEIKGNMDKKNTYIHICKIIYQDIISYPNYNNLPDWVKGHISRGYKFCSISNPYQSKLDSHSFIHYSSFVHLRGPNPWKSHLSNFMRFWTILTQYPSMIVYTLWHRIEYS